MASDWTKDETISQPTRITIEYNPLSSTTKQSKKQVLVSTQKTVTTTTYRTFEYKDSEGQPQQEDVAVTQEAVTSNTIAAVCQSYVSALLGMGASLPSGSAGKREVTTSEYATTPDGVKKTKERVEVWISQYELVGGLNVPFETIINIPGGGAPPSLPWEPSEGELLSAITETVYEESVVPGPYPGAPGKPYTRTLVSRWACRGQTQEGKEAFNTSMKTIESTDAATRLPYLIASMEELVFDGTQISTSIGRTPVLSRPSGQEIDALAVKEAEGEQPQSTYDSENDFGNAQYASWGDYNQVGYNGEPDWISLIPGWQDYASSGTPDDADAGWVESGTSNDPPWAVFVPAGEDWRDYDTDSDNDGIPDWAALVPGPEFYDADSNGDGIPDWAEFVPDGSSRAKTYVTATYDMPYGPTSFIAYALKPTLVGGQEITSEIIQVNNEEAKRRFGEVENTIRIGHALGINITSEAKALPTAPLAPIYVNAEGLVAGFLMNGVSWAFDGNGLVVSADLLLMGVAGLDPSVEEAQAWVRLPAGTGGLQTLDLDPDIGSLVPANTIDMPEDLPAADRYRVFRWLPRDGADVLGPSLEPDRSLVAPFQQRSRMIGRSRHRAQMEEYPFRLSTTEELVGVVRAVSEEAPPEPEGWTVVAGNATPFLGAQAAVGSPEGWNDLALGFQADDNYQTINLPFGFKLAGQTFNECFPGSNGYITFESGYTQYEALSESIPAQPKLFFFAGDHSWQRLLTASSTASGPFQWLKIRWEGSVSYMADTSDSYFEITLFSNSTNEEQFIEVRSGDISSPSSNTAYIAVGSASTWYAQTSQAAVNNRSWVCTGNADGTSWTIQEGYHIPH